ncbi:hypothetical protein BJ165DRAFT_619805 [Panaeolus papilionaceus]|nr:hypothetical protein BJ165DRAFT_619805 [Panaeolus papilionaceus]
MRIPSPLLAAFEICDAAVAVFACFANRRFLCPSLWNETKGGHKLYVMSRHSYRSAQTHDTYPGSHETLSATEACWRHDDFGTRHPKGFSDFLSLLKRNRVLLTSGFGCLFCRQQGEYKHVLRLLI